MSRENFVAMIILYMIVASAFFVMSHNEILGRYTG